MLDLALLAFFGVLLLFGLRHPFIWVLAYLYVDIVSPQRVGWTFLQSLPISLIAFAAAFSGWLLIDRKDGARFTLRQGERATGRLIRNLQGNTGGQSKTGLPLGVEAHILTIGTGFGGRAGVVMANRAAQQKGGAAADHAHAAHQ